MLCECCKIREANIQYTEIVNGVKTEHNFCAQCARDMDFGPYSAIFDSDFPLGKLLSGLLGVGETQGEKEKKVVCPTCGMSYSDFIRNSRFGCADCYGFFDLLIDDKIKQLQGSTSHKGKRPKYHREQAAEFAEAVPEAVPETQTADGETADGMERLRILEARLAQAVKQEEYEAAARFRDEIRSLRAQSGQAQTGAGNDKVV